MKTLYLDTFSGIAGDMFLGLLIDLGLDPQQLELELGKLPLSGYRLDIGREQRHGIAGTRVQVLSEEGHHHRTWSSIDGMLAESELAPGVSALARRFFRRLGEAEAKVHGIPIDQVHFHEVGAVDAIVDLTGAAIGLNLLGITRLLCAPLPLSRGMSRCAHGMLPLPAPATLEILQGKPVCASNCDKELVTPTGATIVAELADFSALPALPLGTTGYGVGGWQLEDRPNLLRGILYQELLPNPREQVRVLETHIDDSTPEQLGFLQERLFAAGALDVGYAPLQMKKNRPGHSLTVICQPEDAARLTDLVLEQSSAIGVRSYSAERSRLERRQERVVTPYGAARVKLLYRCGEFLRLSAEFEDCRRISLETGKSLHEIMRLVEHAGHEQLDLADQESDDEE
jgi:uncharacterized protein (TIGR00299 family) protein